MDISKEIKKSQKRMTLELNKMKGKMGEDLYRVDMESQRYNVKRTGKGSDFEVRKVSLLGKKGPKTLVDIKSSRTAPVSKLQKKTKKKSRRYKVVRYEL